MFFFTNVRMTQKDKVIGNDSISIHQNKVIKFFVKVNVNRFFDDMHSMLYRVPFLKRYR